MTLIGEVFEPFVQYDIPLPALIQLSTVFVDESSQRDVALLSADDHGFGQLAVQIGPYRDIGIDEQTIIGLQMVSQRQRDRVATALENIDVQVTVAGNTRAKAAIESVNLRNQSQKSQVVTFIKRHQTDKATWLYNRLWNQMGIEQHAINIARTCVAISGSYSTLNTGTI